MVDQKSNKHPGSARLLAAAISANAASFLLSEPNPGSAGVSPASILWNPRCYFRKRARYGLQFRLALRRAADDGAAWGRALPGKKLAALGVPPA